MTNIVGRTVNLPNNLKGKYENWKKLQKLWSRQESNLHLKFRKLLFYPLNYGTSFFAL